jgi:UDP-4-amino-4,6-dideoxy-N-acetyl-beta-L-altrosamine N-acetyltransferase
MNDPSLRLREVLASDCDRIYEWRNSERVHSVMASDHIILPDEHRDWFDRMLVNPSVKYLIFELSDEPCGLVCFTDINRTHERGSWGFYLGRGDLPKGTGTRLGFLSLEYAFEALLIRKLCGEVLEYNEPSNRLFRKLGFIQEGRLQKHIYKSGNYHDIILYAIFSSDWISAKEELRRIVFA